MSTHNIGFYGEISKIIRIISNKHLVYSSVEVLLPSPICPCGISNCVRVNWSRVMRDHAGAEGPLNFGNVLHLI